MWESIQDFWQKFLLIKKKVSDWFSRRKMSYDPADKSPKVQNHGRESRKILSKRVCDISGFMVCLVLKKNFLKKAEDYMNRPYPYVKWLSQNTPGEGELESQRKAVLFL